MRPSDKGLQGHEPWEIFYQDAICKQPGPNNIIVLNSIWHSCSNFASKVFESQKTDH